jgi:protocatechuate 3,4-dioxygenase beta subunit
MTQRNNPGFDDSLTARTDASGAYRFTDLPPGNYVLETDRNGFVTKRYGQQGQNNSSRPLTLNPSQNLERIDLALAAC